MNENFKSAQLFLEELCENPPKLPYDPSILRDLFTMTSAGSSYSTESIAAVVERSPGLATNILTLANSVRYALVSKVSSIANAVRILGLNEIRNLTIILGANASINRNKLPEAFSIKALWEHQFITAEISRALCKIQKQTSTSKIIADPNEVYTSSLLHDLGKLMIAYLRPKDWEAINNCAKNENISSSEAEDKHWGIDHGTIAGHLLRDWGLPEVLTESIACHHCPELAGAYKETAMLVAIADHFATKGEQAMELWANNEDVQQVISETIHTHLSSLGFSIELIMPSMAEAFERSRSMNIAGQI